MKALVEESDLFQNLIDFKKMYSSMGNLRYMISS